MRTVSFHFASTSAFGRVAARGELRGAIALDLAAADAVTDVVAIRSRKMQHQVAERVRCLVRPPPQIVVRHQVEAFADLRGKVVDEARAYQVQQRGLERAFHARDNIERELEHLRSPEA